MSPDGDDDSDGNTSSDKSTDDQDQETLLRLSMLRNQKRAATCSRIEHLCLLKRSRVFKHLLPPLQREIIDFLYPRGKCAIYIVQFYRGEWCGMSSHRNKSRSVSDRTTDT